MRQFVAEQYVARTDAAAAERGASAARLAAEQLTREGTPVAFVRSVFIPEDETCIHIYQADSIEAVRALVARASLRFDRLAEAMTTPGSGRRVNDETSPSALRDHLERDGSCRP